MAGHALAMALWAVTAAQPASAEANSDTIVITGERTKRSLKETSSSVSVATSRDIQAASADRVSDLLQLVPNVQLGGGSEGPAIRGQDTTGALQALPAFLGGNRPRTTVIVDGRRTTYNEFVFSTVPTWDLDRIEVFRSPQATTQGQNSIAGAIFVYTQDPRFEPEAALRAGIGNFGMRQVSAMVTAPLSGDVAVRAAGDFRYARTTSHITDRIEGGDPNHDVYGVARVKLLVQPRALPDTRLVVTYTHNQSQKPQLLGLTPPFRERRDTSGQYGTFRINVDAITANLSQQLAQDLSANITVTGGDSVARRLAPAHFGEALNKGRDWSAEGVVNWTPSDSRRAVAGISRTHVRLKQAIDLSLLDGAIGKFSDRQDSIGLFGEASMALVPRLTLTTGLRYQEDRQERDGALATNFGTIPLTYDRTFRAWLPKVSLAYDFTPDVRAGLMVQRAYNPGGTTLRFDIARPDEFEAERLWDYELFLRAKLAPGITAAASGSCGGISTRRSGSRKPLQACRRPDGASRERKPQQNLPSCVPVQHHEHRHQEIRCGDDGGRAQQLEPVMAGQQDRPQCDGGQHRRNAGRERTGVDRVEVFADRQAIDAAHQDGEIDAAIHHQRGCHDARGTEGPEAWYDKQQPRHRGNHFHDERAGVRPVLRLANQHGA